MVSNGRDGHGLIGYGISMYNPLCAYTCRSVLSTSMLNCSHSMHMSEGMEMEMGGETSPECYATDNVFLQTLAYCMSTHCQHVDIWELEKYWQLNVAGTQPDQPLPKLTYQQALRTIATKPTDTLILGQDLNSTMSISDQDYRESFNAQSVFEGMERNHETYGCVFDS